MSEPPARNATEWGWTAPQRRALLLLLLCLLGWLGLRAGCDRLRIADPQPAQGTRAGELATRLDPNTADWQTLAAIPMLGEKRARAIVAYRDRDHAGGANTVAFHAPEDLMRVRGIGPATVENLRPYLVFPAAPATLP